LGRRQKKMEWQLKSSLHPPCVVFCLAVEELPSLSYAAALASLFLLQLLLPNSLFSFFFYLLFLQLHLLLLLLNLERQQLNKLRGVRHCSRRSLSRVVMRGSALELGGLPLQMSQNVERRQISVVFFAPCLFLVLSQERNR